MFAHLADETRNLSHAFIGALFSVILVMSGDDAYSVLGICIALYVIFVFVLCALHFYHKAVSSQSLAVAKRKKGSPYLLYATVLSLVSVITWLFLLLFVATGELPVFRIEFKLQVIVGMLLYAVFLAMMGAAHFSAMSSEEGRSSGEGSTDA